VVWPVGAWQRLRTGEVSGASMSVEGRRWGRRRGGLGGVSGMVAHPYDGATSRRLEWRCLMAVAAFRGGGGGRVLFH
jgi:hypothetical protein